MTTNPGFSTAPTGGGAVHKVLEAASKDWVRKIVDVVNRLVAGKMNVVLQITLAESETSTVITDARIGAFSGIVLQPLTSDAAAALYSATSVLVKPTTQVNGTLTLEHASIADTDLTFNMIILG